MNVRPKKNDYAREIAECAAEAIDAGEDAGAFDEKPGVARKLSSARRSEGGFADDKVAKRLNKAFE